MPLASNHFVRLPAHIEIDMGDDFHAQPPQLFAVV